MNIFHIALRSDWEAATRAGEYRVSTRGRSLEQEGFIHAAFREQVRDVYAEFYAGVREPIVLLTIDPARLRAQVREERVGDRVFPHIYGPLNRSAVIQATALDTRGRPVQFSQVMVREMAWRMGAGVVIMALIVLLVQLAAMLGPDWMVLLGLLAGVVLAVPIWRWCAHRFG